jgi:hypothetical protein
MKRHQRCCCKCHYHTLSTKDHFASADRRFTLWMP